MKGFFILVSRSRVHQPPLRVKSSGMIETLEVDIPRLDYDPIMLQPKGLFIEEAKPNAIVRSND